MAKKFKSYLMLIVVAVMFAGVVQAEILYTHKEISFNDEKAIHLSDDWTLQKTGQSIKLPIKIDAAPWEKVVISRLLPENPVDGTSICVRTSMQNVKIYIDGELLYDSYPKNERFIGKTSGSLWNFIRVPQNEHQSEITIEITSPYPSRSGKLNDVLYGSKSSILFSIIEAQLPDFIISIIFIIIGIVIIILSISLSRASARSLNLAYIGIFSILTGLWFLGESKMMQFFSNDIFLVTNINFLALLLAPIPFVIYVYNAYESHLGKLTDIFVLGFSLNFIASIIFQFAGIADFYEMLPSISAMIILCGVTLIFSLGYEVVKYKDRSAITLLLASSVLMTGVTMEFIQFFGNKSTGSTEYFKIGVLSFILVLSATTISNIIKMMNQARETKYLEQLAYVDLLTQGLNRTAYDRDIKSVFSSAKEGELWLAMFDLNNLKYTNDNFGHSAGDKILQSTYEAIKVSFGKQGRCYRIGGDEFAVIFKERVDGEFMRSVKYFEKIVKSQEKGDFNFDVAYGYEKFNKDKFENFMELSKKVDELMYLDKKLKKERLKVQAASDSQNKKTPEI
ncbi:MAG: diguanylate cyclase [Oscillospiraceae bacterium]